MKLKETALKAIDNSRTRLKLAIALDVTEQTIIRYIADNNDNLTKAAALSVIKAATNLPEEELLESTPVNA